ncbi:MAG: pentapeptide repeat-containing protein [Cyanobacteria bacterium P01_F01_bin.143]
MMNLKNVNLSHSDLKDVNLSYSDLRNAELLEANLTGADLSGANVENARFGYNLGISESLKLDLIAREAIFEDSHPGDRSRVLTPV